MIKDFNYFIDAPVRIDLETRKNRYSFLCVCSLIPLKNVALLIRSFSLLPKADLILHIVGEGPRYRQLKHLAALLNISHKVIWHGASNNLATRHLMSNTNCLVLPSMYDGWGVVVTEALMHGNFILCSDKCGAADAVIASGYGKVFASNSPRELAFSMWAHYISWSRGCSPHPLSIAVWATDQYSVRAGAALLDSYCQDISY